MKEIAPNRVEPVFEERQDMRMRRGFRRKNRVEPPAPNSTEPPVDLDEQEEDEGHDLNELA